MTNLKLSTSFLQDTKHVSKSDKYVQVQSSSVAELFLDHGFELTSVKTGKARKMENKDHQTTITRLMRNDADLVALGGQGSTLDILFKNPQLGGSLEFRLGWFRGFCANQWNSGHVFQNIKIRHAGDTLNEIERLVPELVAKRDEMIETIRLMNARTVNQTETLQILQHCANLRLADTNNVSSIDIGSFKPRRSEDVAPTLLNVLNVADETIQRYGIQYTTKTTNEQGQVIERNFTTRRMQPNSVSSFEIVGSIWDFGVEYLKAA